MAPELFEMCSRVGALHGCVALQTDSGFELGLEFELRPQFWFPAAGGKPVETKSLPRFPRNVTLLFEQSAPRDEAFAVLPCAQVRQSGFLTLGS